VDFHIPNTEQHSMHINGRARIYKSAGAGGGGYTAHNTNMGIIPSEDEMSIKHGERICNINWIRNAVHTERDV